MALTKVTYSMIAGASANVLDFGADPTGVADSTAAFVAANNYLMTQPLPPSAQLVGGTGVVLFIPAGEYKISGNRIFGSIIPTGDPASAPPRFYQIYGNGASLIWNASPGNELFYFDGSIDHPIVKNLNIYIKGQTNNVPAGTLFRFYSNSSVANQFNASKFHLEDVSAFPARDGSNNYFWERIFRNTGDTQNDQALVENCRFWYFDKMYVGENAEAVNWSFSSCTFFANSNLSDPATYFEFTRLQDNFNILDCSFSFNNRETLVYTNNAAYIDVTNSNINFDNCRLEADIGGAGSGFVGTPTISSGAITAIAVTNGGSGYSVAPTIEVIDSTGIGCTATCTISAGVITSVTVVNQGSGYSASPSIYAKEYYVTAADMNFGTLNMRNSTWSPASNGAYFQEIRLRGNARFMCDNVQFINPQFYMPVYDGSYIGSGSLVETAVDVRNSSYQNKYDLYASLTTDPGYAYRYTARVIGGFLVRAFHAKNFGQYNGQRYYDFDISSVPSNTQVTTFQSRQVSVAYNNSGIAQYIELPPFQAIYDITISGASTLAKYYRVYFGDKTAGVFVDTEIINFNTFASETYNLFGGFATIFTDDLTAQKIYVAPLNAAKAEITITAPIEVLITYRPVQWKSAGLTTVPQTIVRPFVNQISKVFTRPTDPPYVGYTAFDTVNGIPIWWDGTGWVDSAGNPA